MDYAQAIKDMNRETLEGFALSTFSMNADLQALAGAYNSKDYDWSDQLWEVGNNVVGYFEERGLL